MVAAALPLSPPPSSLTPLSSLLSQILSPPLPLPSPPLPLPALSSPLLLPATNHREDFLEADVPPQKRLCLTAPAPRFEVGESSAAAAARQPGLDVGTVDATARCPMSREKMLPKRTTTTTTIPMIDAAIKALIAQGVADALDKYEAHRSSRNGYDIHESGSGRRKERDAREYTYSDFLKCQPLNFMGTEGVVGLTQWFEKIKYVFHISNCTITCQIKFATCTLLRNALTWWNSYVKTVGHDVAYGMP
ncbi:hypothetical protein Tco_0088712 [Tanacetum coccineum]